MAYNYKTDAKLQTRLLAEVVALIEEPANSICCDCGAKLRPRAAFCSITLGVWLCNRCYGIHRAVGAHVTRTKCVGLDAFSQAEVDFMRSHGNARAKLRYEATAPHDISRPSVASGNSQAEEWIRAKYELRKFYRELPPSAVHSTPPQSIEPSLIDFGSAGSAPAAAVLQPAAQSAMNPLELYAQSLLSVMPALQPTQLQQQQQQQQPQQWGEFASIAAAPNGSTESAQHDQRKKDIKGRSCAST
jgi:stromal membrane-associated protein